MIATFLYYTTSNALIFYKIMLYFCAVCTDTSACKTKFSTWFEESNIEQKYF